MVETTNMLQYNPVAVQGTVNIIWYIVIGVLVLVVFFVLIKRLYDYNSYTHKVFIHRRVGNAVVIDEDLAKQVKMDNKYFMHYLKINKYSPIIDSKFFCIAKTKKFGIQPTTMLSFHAHLTGESIFPVMYNENEGLMPINIDLYNYLQSRVKMIHEKFEKKSLLITLLPIIAIGFIGAVQIIIAIFYTKHVETIAKMVLDKASSSASEVMNSAQQFLISTGKANVIPPRP